MVSEVKGFKNIHKNGDPKDERTGRPREICYMLTESDQQIHQ
jgi:hypothetical protein